MRMVFIIKIKLTGFSLKQGLSKVSSVLKPHLLFLFMPLSYPGM